MYIFIMSSVGSDSSSGYFYHFTEGEKIPFLNDRSIEIPRFEREGLTGCLFFCLTEVQCAGVKYTSNEQCFMMTRDSSSKTAQYTVQSQETVYRKGILNAHCYFFTTCRVNRTSKCRDVCAELFQKGLLQKRPRRLIQKRSTPSPLDPPLSELPPLEQLSASSGVHSKLIYLRCDKSPLLLVMTF